ncbi:HNH endonuclease family protein [Spirilliplanes yamanashiensis]|uniref:GmrSD restriction endonucleases C-terminal domain-containing protein n=1 Tax=Spirilliplanes yamanashiensis TaxID=42233 RepID=A0A8J3Y5P4_9ACTN|nr:HNH endonuclease family protein [Spirilliplanes yamanashiensis]MDP9814657.1 hypothetical protein [Spirilliplanes yamanashiensis]GIJ02311.1 hypothetical protein Sya03_16630 [Spirilliplanes yamanashiensis]
MRAPLAVLSTAALLALTGCEIYPAPPSGDPGAATGNATLDDLTVARAASMRGYSRDHFPHWRDTGDNCDIRDSVLTRDGQKVRHRGCNVTGGTFYSVYDGKTVYKPADVDIDHMVPLANAWRSGAAKWTEAKRGEFANDLDTPQLVVATQATNRSKGDQDPSQWKPPRRESWCSYARDWIAVKAHWKLTVTTAEKMALADMLETCAS